MSIDHSTEIEKLTFRALALCQSKLFTITLPCSLSFPLGAFFIEKLAEVFDSLHDCQKDSYGQGKECVNVVALFAYLYNFKVSYYQ